MRGNLGNFCLYLPPRCFHCTQKVNFSRYVSGMCQVCVRSVVLYGSQMAGVRYVSGVLFSMACVRCSMCQVCVRSVVLYGSQMAGVRYVSGVLFSMAVRWQVSGMCQECCSLMAMSPGKWKRSLESRREMTGRKVGGEMSKVKCVDYMKQNEMIQPIILAGCKVIGRKKYLERYNRILPIFVAVYCKSIGILHRDESGIR